MKIVVKQIKSNFKNEFEVLVNDEKKYVAKTPVIHMIGFALRIDKKLPIVIEGIDGKKLESTYNVIDNFKEEFIPFKYLAVEEQKFDQFTFRENDEKIHCQIYFSQKEYLRGNYVINQNDKYFNAYVKGTGSYINVSIYDDSEQIAQIIKLNVIQDGNDTYTIFLKDEYKSISESLIAFTLYLDRLYFNYGFMKNTTNIQYVTTFSKNEDKYDSNWVNENFDATDFYKECEMILEESKRIVKKKFMIIGLGIIVTFIVAFMIAMLLMRKGL